MLDQNVASLTGWDGNDNIFIKAYNDNAVENVTFPSIQGGSITTEIAVTNIDKIAPTITGRYTPATPTNGSVEVSITGSDGTGS
jgi:hypothetical protein